MESKDSVHPLERKTKYIYELGADVTLEFDNEDTIRINKTVLAFHTEFLADVFFGPIPATNFKVENFDSETFRTFLDCLFGLKKYSVLDSLLIYPIAHQYQVKESLEKCVDVLTPTTMDENIVLILNLALFYKDDVLVKSVIDFIGTQSGIVNFIEVKEYRDLLEPMSMCRLIEKIVLDSFVWKLIYEWGERYLTKHCKSVDIRSFFDEIGIFSKLELDHFESVQCIFDFHEMTNMQLLDSDMILAHLKSRMLDPTNGLPDNSEWLKLKTNTFTEIIEFSHSYVSSSEDHKNGLSIQIWANKVVIDKSRVFPQPICEVEAEYYFRNISLNVRDVYDLRHESSCSGQRGSSQDCKCWVPLETSALDDSRSKKVEWNLRNVSDSEICTLHVKTPQHHFQEIKSVKVTYHFRNVHDLRILKTTLKGDFVKANELYFTKNVLVYPKPMP